MHWRYLAAAVVVLLYALFCAAFVRRARRRANAAQAARAGADDAAAWLVAYASQTGYAEQLALRTAEALRRTGLAVRVAMLGELDAAALGAGDAPGATRHALFVVSTTGEGDAPDGAARFVRRTMGAGAQLHGLRYGLLALGDRSYAHFCGFGHALDRWLRHHGAQALFDPVEVDNGDPGALRHWQHHLGQLAGHVDLADWSAPGYEGWRLAERRLLNPDSAGAPVFHLALARAAGAVAPDAWAAGDIAEIGPRNARADVERWLAHMRMDGAVLVDNDEPADPGREPLADRLARCLLPWDEAGRAALVGLSAPALVAALAPLPHREYSIASLPADGRLELLVRRMRHPDGRLGLGSGWLTAHAPPGAIIDLRIRANRGFHAPDGDRPLVFVGNGTGLAGLRAHLKARAAAGHARNWLVFGERNRAHDFFFEDEIAAWQRAGLLARVDLAFSRDQAARIYVQQRLREQAATLRAWVDEGAAILVCGSLEGMAREVDAALAEILGADVLDALADAGRYRRDVY